LTTEPVTPPLADPPLVDPPLADPPPAGVVVVGDVGTLRWPGARVAGVVGVARPPLDGTVVALEPDEEEPAAAVSSRWP
jgi:hypothetical protein